MSEFNLKPDEDKVRYLHENGFFYSEEPPSGNFESFTLKELKEQRKISVEGLVLSFQKEGGYVSIESGNGPSHSGSIRWYFAWNSNNRPKLERV